MEEPDSQFVLYNGIVIGPANLHRIRNEDYRRVASRFPKGKRLEYNPYKKKVTITDLLTGNVIKIKTDKPKVLKDRNLNRTRRNRARASTLKTKWAKVTAVPPENYTRKATERTTRTSRKAAAEALIAEAQEMIRHNAAAGAGASNRAAGVEVDALIDEMLKLNIGAHRGIAGAGAGAGAVLNTGVGNNNSGTLRQKAKHILKNADPKIVQQLADMKLMNALAANFGRL
jgi:hypothetical protein